MSQHFGRKARSTGLIQFVTHWPQLATGMVATILCFAAPVLAEEEPQWFTPPSMAPSSADSREANFTVADVIPTQMAPSNNLNDVARTIFDFSFKNYLHSPAVKSSKWGRSAERLQESLQTNVSFGSADAQRPSHQIKVEVDPAQAGARIKYSGLFHFNVHYKVAAAEMKYEVVEKISSNGTLVVDHTELRSQSSENISMRWEF